MRSRLWILLCLLCLAGAWFFWQQPVNMRTRPSALQKVAKTVRPHLPSSAPNILATVSTNSATSAKTNQFAYRLSNTTRTIGQLVGDRHAILLENALIDTASPLNLSIPKNLQSQGDPGAYIVQARGPIDNAFRAMLAAAGAEIVSYIPNDAYLVRAPAGVANGLAANPLTQAVISYEPYYKISSAMPVTVGQKTFSSAPMETNRAAGPSLLELAVKQSPLPAGTYLKLGMFKDGAAATVAQIEKLGGRIIARDNSPFGPVVRVQPPQNWTVLATLPGVQIVEPYRQRVHANDLSRATVGVAADTQVATNYLGLTGKNVMVEVNDSGIDAGHLDLTGRVIGDPANLFDTSGHGTHVAGIIAGNGSMSSTITNAQGSIMPATNGQFRGKAPAATLLSMDMNDSDQELQEAAALTNALISNNSWDYGSGGYDLAAASYDAATRDALPLVMGSQPVLFVFAAGNSGDGNKDNNGGGGDPDTILSPATAKNVITVGAIEQLRYITNTVTDRSSNSSAFWQTMTDSGYSPYGDSVSSQVASFSSRGNVGVGIEGAYGRYKPDVVAPGTFVVSTRSQQWDEKAYYNPTNYNYKNFANQIVHPNSLSRYNISIPANAVGVIITIEANSQSPTPFPTNLPIYVRQAGLPTTNTYDFVTWNNEVAIPPNSGGSIASIASIQNSGFYYGVGNTNNFLVSYDLTTEVITTNDLGNYSEVLSNLNDSLDGDISPHYYRYESGTSMSAADVSGVLALMQDYFTNTLHATPSPALLKAMLINGARPTGYYDFQVQNSINYQGWGLINLPDSLPPGLTTNVSNGSGEAMLILDQSPATALATGDSHTYEVDIPDGSDQQYLPLQVTLTWTDPPGNPAAAIKLVNSLELVVSNADTGDVFYGNDIASGYVYNTPEVATNTPNYDAINNVENVFISWPLGTKYFITVIGRSVNVNAVTAHPNNVVQDYALVISCGEGEVPNAFTVTDKPIVSNPTGGQQITYVVTTNAPLLDQFAGASTPLLGTDTIQLTNDTELNGIQLGGTNIVTLGMTNQWHFYVVTNTGAADFTNAAFITFIPDTLSIPRMGVFEDSVDNATRPEADIDLYVSANPALTNLDPVVISGADKSLGRGGTEFVYYTNSAPGDVYYVGVYSEDREGSEYGFIPIITDIPFSQMNSNGDQIVNGLVLPVNIPDGSPAHPGVGYVFSLAIYPMEVKRVVATNIITHQNFGDLIGVLAHGQQNGLSKSIVLNNHDSLGNTFGPPPRTLIYDDSGQGDIVGSQPSDGPGSLNSYVGQQGTGPWILTEVDDSLTQTGAVTGFNLLIEPHQDLGKGITGTVNGNSWFYDYIDVPAGATSLTILAINQTASPASLPLQLFVRLGAEPTLTDYDEMVTLTGTPQPSGTIFIPSPPPGRYWIGLWNPNVAAQNFYLIATIDSPTPPGQVIFGSSGPAPILDDAVVTNSLFVTRNEAVSSVEAALRVDHPRVSDLVFHLTSPDGTRCLLVENRGGTTTNGMGASLAITNNTAATSSGGAAAATNVVNVLQTSGTLAISYNFQQEADQMWVFAQAPPISTAPIFNSGMVSGSGVFNIPYTGTSQLTLVMNPTNNPNSDTWWDYTVDSAQGKYTYLVLTEDTNKTTTPIKFAPVPFQGFLTNQVITNITYTTNWVAGTNALVIAVTNVPMEWTNGFEGAAAGDYVNGNVFDGWTVNSNQVTVISNSVLANLGTNLLALASGTISRILPTVPGQTYTLTYAYRGPGIVSLWRGENNALDSISGNNGILTNDIGFAAGEVNSAFSMGTNGFVFVPPAPSLDVGPGPGFTIDAWVDPTNLSVPNPVIEWDWPPNYICSVQLYVSSPFFGVPGCLFAGFQNSDQSINPWYNSAANIVTPNSFHHVALTFCHETGNSALYLDGNVVATANLGSCVPATSAEVLIGRRINLTDTSQNFHFFGKEDEISVYGRDLSASEIKAIYQKGTAGKFDPTAPTIAQGLAKAQVTVGGSSSPAFYGSNTNWQTNTITFTAAQNNTPLQITGLEPGMLLDNFVLTNLVVVTYWTNYMPNGFEGAAAGDYYQGEFFDGWAENTNQVTVITDTHLAYQGSNLLALADGQISRILPTVPGSNYILSFAYRGPSAVGLWRGETNANDSVDGNNGTLMNGATFGVGEVGNAFEILGPEGPDHIGTVGPYVQVPDSDLWAFGTNDFAIDLWANFASMPNSYSIGYPFGGAFISNNEGPYTVNKWWFAEDDYQLDFHINGPGINGGAGVFLVRAPFIPVLNQWYHFAITRHGNLYTIYTNGVAAGSQTDTTVIPNPNAPLTIGATEGFYFNGLLDEVTIYNRAISDSEIQAIYNQGFMGKYDPTAPSIAQGLAEAQVTVGGTNLIFFGNNTNWQTTNITFTAAQSNMVLQITGIEPGMLLDSFALTNVVITTNLVVTTNLNGGDVYYLPEESLDTFAGGRAQGQWQLEIWDNRAGAGLTNTLVSWQLRFNFATNLNTISVLTNGLALTNVIPPGGMEYYLVEVPPNADWATNILFSTTGLPLTGPLNVWFNPTTLPVGANPPDYVLITNSTGGRSILGLNTNPTNIVPGGTYYLGVQNLGAASVTYGIEVDFHLLFPPVLPPTRTYTVYELTLLTVTNTATSAYPPVTYSLTSDVPGLPVPVIDANGIITWTPSEAQGPGFYTIQTVATDSSATPLHTTNSIYVRVIEVNTPPFFLGTPPDQTISAYSTLIVTNAAGDSDIPANPLTYTLLNPPDGMTIDANGVITWTPTQQAPATNLITTVVTDFNANAPVNQHLSATNFFYVYVTGVPAPFAFTQPATSVTGTSAQLNGMATPNGPPTMAWFEWGTSANYGNQTPPVSVGGSFAVVYVTNQINGLVMNQPYHFRLVVSNLVGVVYGFDQIFDETGVVAWGADYLGQTNVPAGLSNVVAVAAAYDHSLSLKNDGTVAAWGDGLHGQTNVPAGLNGVVAVAGGEFYSLALKNNGTVMAWGANTIPGQTNVPPSLNSVVNIAGGGWSSLALKSNGRVVAWGYNIAGLTNVPAGLSNVVAVAGGALHSMAVKNDGTVVAWGDDAAGQTDVPAGLTNVVAIAGGGFHSLALKYDGTVVAWGDDSDGQSDVPAGLSNVVAVAAGGFHSLVLKNDGSVLAWGDNSTNQTTIPIGLSNVVAISSGYFHNLALASPFNVNLTNTPPFFLVTNPPPVTMDEMTTLLVTNTAGDSDLPPQTLTYSLLDPPAWANVDTNSGVITLSPLEADGPTNVTITAVVTDNGVPALSATNSFTVTVNEVNLPPVLSLPPNTNIEEFVAFTAQATATDPDIPVNPLTFALVSGPAGLTVTTDGVITWTPTNIGTSVVTISVTDTNPPAVNQTSFSVTNQFNITVTAPPLLVNGVPQTNVLAAGGLEYYLVNVPTNADFATNRLLFATGGPLNVWFTTNLPPTITNASDSLLIANATSGSSVLMTNTTPPLLPGSTYYLGVQNTNSVTVTYAIEVDFHLPSANNGIFITSITATNIGGTNGFLLQWQGPTNFQYEIQWTTNLLPLIAWHPVLNPVINVVVTSTNGHFSFFDDGTLTGGFGRLKFYRVLGSLNLGPITGSGPATNTVLAGATSQAVVTVPAGAISASNFLISATGPLNVWFNQTNPPAGNASTGDFLLLSATSAGSFVLTNSSVPPLVPGTNYYLGFQNPGASDVTFVFQAAFGFATTNAISNFSITVTNGSIWLRWNGLTNYQYQVAWTTNLASPIVWQYVPPTPPYFTSVTTNFTFVDTYALGGMRFYRIIEYP